MQKSFDVNQLNHLKSTLYIASTQLILTQTVGLEELAKCPNVYAKVSGVLFIDPKFNQTTLEGVVKPVLEIFGIDRYVLCVCVGLVHSQ